jgi:tyrosyl-tRNA synthetase
LCKNLEGACFPFQVKAAYLEQDASRNAVTDAFFQSKKLSAHDVANAIDFIEAVAKKLLRSSHKALTKEIEERGISHSGERKNALESIIWWRALIT